MASAFSSIRARCPQKVRRRDLTMYESGDWLEMQQMWAFLTKSCQRMFRILRRHHWSTASIRCISALFSYPAFRSTEYGSTKSCTDRVWSRSLSVASASVDQDTALQLQCMEPGGLYGSHFNRVPALPSRSSTLCDPSTPVSVPVSLRPRPPPPMTCSISATYTAQLYRHVQFISG